MIRAALSYLAHCRGAGQEPVLELNLSAKSIVEPTLLKTIESEAGAAGVDPRGLVFEVTETEAIVNVAQAREFANGLHALGCEFALDDFGAGFASFDYLKRLTFDYVKIDGDFVEGLTRSRTNQLVVKSIADIAQGLGKQTIAEYVSDAGSVEILRDFGVDYAQGHQVGEPVPLAGLTSTQAVKRVHRSGQGSSGNGGNGRIAAPAPGLSDAP